MVACIMLGAALAIATIMLGSTAFAQGQAAAQASKNGSTYRRVRMSWLQSGMKDEG